MLASVQNNEVPPDEMSGSGIPLVGTRESTTLMLKKACSRMLVVMPKATRRAKGSWERKAVRRPRTPKRTKSRNDEHGADEAKLLGNVGEDEVGVRLGQVEELLHAFHVAAAGEAAGADGDERLVDVEAGALRIGIGIEEDQHALAAPRNHEKQRGQAGQQRRTAAPKQILPLHSGQDQHHGGDAGQNQRRAQVGLLDDEQDKDQRHDGGAQQGVLPVAHLVKPGVEEPGQKQDQTGLAISDG